MRLSQQKRVRGGYLMHLYFTDDHLKHHTTPWKIKYVFFPPNKSLHNSKHLLTCLPAGYSGALMWRARAVIVDCYGKQSDRMGSRGDFCDDIVLLLTLTHLWMEQVKMWAVLLIIFFVTTNQPLQPYGRLLKVLMEWLWIHFLKPNFESAQSPVNLIFQVPSGRFGFAFSQDYLSRWLITSVVMSDPHQQGTLPHLSFVKVKK